MTVRAMTFIEPLIDFKEPGAFDQWAEYFKIALGGTAAVDTQDPYIVMEADFIAQNAVIMARKRAKDAGR